MSDARNSLVPHRSPMHLSLDCWPPHVLPLVIDHSAPVSVCIFEDLPTVPCGTAFVPQPTSRFSRGAGKHVAADTQYIPPMACSIPLVGTSTATFTYEVIYGCAQTLVHGNGQPGFHNNTTASSYQLMRYFLRLPDSSGCDCLGPRSVRMPNPCALKTKAITGRRRACNCDDGLAREQRYDKG